jgi:hypothetical protein
MTCAALDWDKKIRDYVECSAPKTIRMVRITGLVTAELPLCDNHREVFEEEMAKFGGHLDTQKRVQVMKGTA